MQAYSDTRDWARVVIVDPGTCIGDQYKVLHTSTPHLQDLPLSLRLVGGRYLC
jgi:hypothetical protein